MNTKWGKALTYIIYVGQLGLDLIMPVLLCIGGCWFLCDRFGIGMWIYIPGFILGLGAGWVTFWHFYTRVVMKGITRPDRRARKRHSFSEHI